MGGDYRVCPLCSERYRNLRGHLMGKMSHSVAEVVELSRYITFIDGIDIVLVAQHRQSRG
ncbi:hypothetical protein SEA_RASPUTIA_66 [Microbacterium phage Rasputia]|nr:hypothetical protein SEA_RASPUTIA_66 [Microbacterium phage Rasputia]